jgi:hypothetical protein
MVKRSRRRQNAHIYVLSSSTSCFGFAWPFRSILIKLQSFPLGYDYYMRVQKT